MAEKQKSAGNMKSKYILLGVMAVVLIAAIVVLVVLGNKNAQPKAVMEMSTNPSVQVVLDGNDKVVAEVALNADGEQLLANVSFMGLKAEVAAEKFAQIANEMDKMNSSTTNVPVSGKSTTVEIKISAETTAEYQELAKKAQNAVNKYFSDNGVFAGAVAQVSNDIKGALSNMGANAKDYANKTTAELLEYAKTTANDLDQITVEARNQLTTKFNTLYNTILAVADKAMETAKDAYESAPEAIKSTFKDAYDSAVKTYNEKKAELDKQFKAFVTELQETCKQALETIKTSAKTAYDQTMTAVKERIDAFKNLTVAEQEAMQQQIATFQQNLLKS